MESADPMTAAFTQRTPCPNGTLVASQGEIKRYCPSLCRRWACERCGRRNARRLADRIMRTPVRRFITLTMQSSTATTTEAQLDSMNAAFRLLWKRIKRRKGNAARGYVKVIEFTRAGTPHLHVAADCGYLPQTWLSEQWRELTGNPIVDIRAVASTRGLARYLAKYLSKSTQTAAHRRKYSAARGWLPHLPAKPLESGEIAPTWRWHREPVEDFEVRAAAYGLICVEAWWYPADVHRRAFGELART